MSDEYRYREPEDPDEVIENSKIRRVINHLLQCGLQTKCDATEMPVALFSQTQPDRWWQIDSPRVRAWIAKEAFGCHEILRNGDVTAIIEILKGLAFENRDTEVCSEGFWEEAEKDPVVRCVIRFMQKRQAWSGSMSELLAALRCAATSFDHRGRPERLPQLSNTLSSILNRSTSTLKHSGIAYSRRRTKRGAEARLESLASSGDGDETGDAPSSRSTPENVAVDVGFSPTGGSDEPTDDSRICKVLEERFRKEPKE